MWVEGIEVYGGKLAAMLATEDGKREFVCPEKLGLVGLPKAPSKNLVLHEVSLRQMTRVSAKEYVAAFGLEAVNIDATRHAVYRLECGELALIVPALALMRGIFKPSSTVLPSLFRAQGLDSICVASKQEVGLVDVVAPWSKLAYRGGADPRQLLSWLYHEPSARKLASSVHVHAMEGALDLDLPDVQVSLSVQGKRVGDTLYVTRCNVNRIDQSVVMDVQRKKTLRLTCTTKDHSVSGELSRLKSFAHQVGAERLTDIEWVAVQETLRLSPRELRVKVDLREVVDCILRKLQSGARWVDVQRPGLPYVTLVGHYSKLVRTGRLDEVLSLLRSLRKTSEESQDS